MRGARTTRHKNITRVDHPAKRTFGYMVRVQWDGVMHYKFFSDKKHGDRLGSLAAAIDWRDKTERSIGKPRTEQFVVGKPRTSNSGIPGVRKRREGHTDYYEATWTIGPGKLGRTRYSVAKYGEAKARRLAKRARDQHEKQRWQQPKSSRSKVAEVQQVLSPLPVVVPSEDREWNDLVSKAAERVGAFLPAAPEVLSH